MTIFTGNYTPYENYTRYQTLRYVISRAQGLKKSLRLIEKDNEHLTLRCPLSGDYVDVVGNPSDIEWLDKQLVMDNWYKPTKP